MARRDSEEHTGRYVPGTSPFHRLPPWARWLIALALAALVFAQDLGWPMLGLLAVTETALYLGASLGWRALRSDIQPLLWQAPLVLLLYGVRDGVAGLPAGAAISGQIVLALLPFLWVQRLTSSGELLALTERLLPDRLALVISLSMRFLPSLARDIQRIVFVQRQRGVPIERRSLWRPWLWGDIVRAVLVPAAVRMVRLSRELELAIRARGIRR